MSRNLYNYIKFLYLNINIRREKKKTKKNKKGDISINNDVSSVWSMVKGQNLTFLFFYLCFLAFGVLGIFEKFDEIGDFLEEPERILSDTSKLWI